MLDGVQRLGEDVSQHVTLHIKPRWLHNVMGNGNETTLHIKPIKSLKSLVLTGSGNSVPESADDPRPRWALRGAEGPGAIGTSVGLTASGHLAQHAAPPTQWIRPSAQRRRRVRWNGKHVY